MGPFLALLDEEMTVFPGIRVVTFADAWFYALLFFTLAGAIIAVAVLMGSNASHSIGSMRSETSGHPNVPSGGRFKGPAVHGGW